MGPPQPGFMGKLRFICKNSRNILSKIFAHFFTILFMRHLQETGDRLFIQGIHIGLIIKPDIIA